MAKFAIGDLARIKYSNNPDQIGLIVEIVAIGPFPEGSIDPNDGRSLRDGCGPADYIVRHGSLTNFWDEPNLEPLPPDETTEDPGLTRLKKLLRQDKIPVKRKEKA